MSIPRKDLIDTIKSLGFIVDNMYKNDWITFKPQNKDNIRIALIFDYYTSDNKHLNNSILIKFVNSGNRWREPFYQCDLPENIEELSIVIKTILTVDTPTNRRLNDQGSSIKRTFDRT